MGAQQSVEVIRSGTPKQEPYFERRYYLTSWIEKADALQARNCTAFSSLYFGINASTPIKINAKVKSISIKSLVSECFDIGELGREDSAI